mmetsp:Transcript_77810/g.137813  ORF Transcript_77810/g.137813 Transcript_77810/m.137813 type:complete len:227 (-) Transcript_77810:678-1358(-)
MLLLPAGEATVCQLPSQLLQVLAQACQEAVLSARDQPSLLQQAQLSVIQLSLLQQAQLSLIQLSLHMFSSLTLPVSMTHQEPQRFFPVRARTPEVLPQVALQVALVESTRRFPPCQLDKLQQHLLRQRQAGAEQQQVLLLVPPLAQEPLREPRQHLVRPPLQEPHRAPPRSRVALHHPASPQEPLPCQVRRKAHEVHSMQPSGKFGSHHQPRSEYQQQLRPPHLLL